MVQVSYPGVYIQEIPSGVTTITGVPTSIAVFIGMAKSGPVNTPTQVLGFLDYTRTFSSDTSLGEMTDQVQQYFQNGGQQAFVVRIADGTSQAAIGLSRAQGVIGGNTTVPVLTLAAIAAGSNGGQLRASVDYNTASPERTFNLTMFREILDNSGNATVQDSELIPNRRSPAFRGEAPKV